MKDLDWPERDNFVKDAAIRRAPVFETPASAAKPFQPATAERTASMMEAVCALAMSATACVLFGMMMFYQGAGVAVSGLVLGGFLVKSGPSVSEPGFLRLKNLPSDKPRQEVFA